MREEDKEKKRKRVPDEKAAGEKKTVNSKSL